MNKALRAVLFGLPLFFTSCAGALSPAERAGFRDEGPGRAAQAQNVVLVTIDGVRWQEIFQGADSVLADRAGLPQGEARTARSLTPNLHRLFFDDGTVLGDPRLGQPFRASGPHYVSLPAYIEIMSGAVSGCAGNDCRPEMPWSLAAAVADGNAPGGAAVFSSWSAISRTIPPGRHVVLEAGRHPDDSSPASPGHDDYRPDRMTAAAALDHLVQHRPRMLWVALGDTDEWAHQNNYRGYIEALGLADEFIGKLCEKLADMGAYGEGTTVIVTTDHGRDENFTDHGGPDSAAVWLMARGGPLPAKGVSGLARPRYLRDIAPTVASLYGLADRRCETCGDPLEELR